jgi:hypothetical protein
MKTDRATIKRFFDLLWPDDVPEGTRLCVWTLAGRRATWCTSVDEAVSAAAASTRDVYAGGGLGLPGLQAGERVRKDTAQGICGLWADIDYSDEVHKKSPYLPPSEADAVELLRMLPHAPTLIVHSGHGLQAWWLFEEAWTFDDKSANALRVSSRGGRVSFQRRAAIVAGTSTASSTCRASCAYLAPSTQREARKCLPVSSTTRGSATTPAILKTGSPTLPTV